DQRGDHKPSEPFSVDFSCVRKSTISIAISACAPTSQNGLRPNTSKFPSGDQFGSLSSRSVGSTSCGLPPSDEIRWIFQGLPGEVAVKAIRFPSGDHRGHAVRIGGNVSWSRWLPSALHRHKVPSG